MSMEWNDLFTTDKNQIQSTIQSSEYNESIDDEVIRSVNKYLVSESKIASFLQYLGDLPPESFDMLIKYLNIYHQNRKINQLMRSKRTDDLELELYRWVSLTYHNYYDDDDSDSGDST